MQDEDGDGDKEEEEEEEDDDNNNNNNNNNPSKNVHNHDHVLDESAPRVDKGKSVDNGNPPAQMWLVCQSSPQLQAQLTSNNV
jgi:ABC-type Zn2+ transport system substrate-binding protein/surface adhesin